MKTISVIGSGSHTRSSINLLKQFYDNYTIHIFDNSYDSSTKEFIQNKPLVGKVNDIDKNSLIFLSLGDNKIRKKFYNQYKENLIKENLYHKTAFMEENLTIGTSNQIFANVYINSCVEIGNNNILNTSSILEHEVKIGDHNHISVSSKLCGRVKIGNQCMIGAGAIIIDKVTICDNVILGAGTVVIQDINESGTYVGNPARKIK